MLNVKADLHIHTVLSPCAETDMSPVAIVQKAFSKGLKIIGITDHNSTLQCLTVKKIADEYGIFTLMGAEVTSKEEIHCLTYFDNPENLQNFQEFIERNIQKIKYNPAIHGVQAVLDTNNNVIEQVDYYLGVPLNAGYEEIEEIVHAMGGIFIPAHVDRIKFSLLSQLGYVPENLKADALEIFNQTPLVQFLRENGHVSHFSFVKNSDAHTLNSIGQYTSHFMIDKINFNEIKMALRKKFERMVLID
ncbi:MAG: PHP domain-containing protein [Bacteroidales bacterium]|nr:PHP domain-containing protein [Bacteroidales bacterium]HPO65471.1 PHP domain-containing protein [Bacteroidales bacterium]